MSPREPNLEGWTCEDQMDITELIEQDVPDQQIVDPLHSDSQEDQ